ncbi:MAG: 30S ribosomal protein S16 [Mycoplasmataceae bacterium]|nr:30S ribosomal protein S16 [Mycoplasmataceae bacterium]
MVKLRLKRMGEKFNAFYRIVAADARAPRDGRFIEEIGYYNPHTKETLVRTELRTKWENEGAVASETVKNLFKKYDAMNKPGEVVKLSVKAKKVKAAPKPVEVKVEEVAVEAEVKTEAAE